MKKILIFLFFAATTLASYSQIQVNSGFKVAAQQSVDDKQYKLVNQKHVPYADTTEFLSMIPKTRRHIGQIAFITGSGGKIDIWQFQGGIEQINLVKFFTDVAITLNKPHPVQTISEMLALPDVNIGDVSTVQDSSKSYILRYEPSNVFSNWIEILNPLLANTDYLPEGETNKYDTPERNRDANNAGVGIGYNKATGVITNLFDPIPGKNISITGTMPSKTFAVTGIYDQAQQDSISNVIRQEIQIAAGGGLLYSQLDSTATAVREDFPTDYFNNRTISPDSLYDILTRKDGTKDTTIYVAGAGGGGGISTPLKLTTIGSSGPAYLSPSKDSLNIPNYAGGGTYTASNGLTIDGNDVKLGGTLNKVTDLSLNEFNLNLYGTTNNTFARLMSLYDNGQGWALGITQQGEYGKGVNVTANKGVPLTLWSTDETSNSVNTALEIRRATTVVAESGVGTKISFLLPTDRTFGITNIISNEIKSSLTNTSSNTPISEFTISGVNGDILTLGDSVGAKLNQYGKGNFLGTPVYNLGVDVDGNIIETTGSGGGGDLSNYYIKSQVDAFLANKQDKLTLTTTGSGAATLIGGALNIPTNSGGGGALSRFGIEDNIGVQDRTVRHGDYSLNQTFGDDSDYINPEAEFFFSKEGLTGYIQNQDALIVNDITLNSTQNSFRVSGTNEEGKQNSGLVYVDPYSVELRSNFDNQNFWSHFYASGDLAEMASISQAADSRDRLLMVGGAVILRRENYAGVPYSEAVFTKTTGSYTIPKSVNGVLADVNGNISTPSGTATLLSGTITVNTTLIKTGAKIFVSVNTPSGTQGFLSAPTSSIINQTSFVINSTSATENSTVNYQIINP